MYRLLLKRFTVMWVFALVLFRGGGCGDTMHCVEGVTV